MWWPLNHTAATVRERAYPTPGVPQAAETGWDALRTLAFCADATSANHGTPRVLLGNRAGTVPMVRLRGADGVWEDEATLSGAERDDVWVWAKRGDVSARHLAIVAPFPGTVFEYGLLLAGPDRDEYHRRAAKAAVALHPPRSIALPFALIANGRCRVKDVQPEHLADGPTLVGAAQGDAWTDAVSWTDATPIPFDVDVHGATLMTVTRALCRCMRGGAMGTYANGVYRLPIGQLYIGKGTRADDVAAVVVSRWPACAHVIQATVCRWVPGPTHEVAALWLDTRFAPVHTSGHLRLLAPIAGAVARFLA